MLELSSNKKEYVMPNIKSAKKRVSVIARRREENRYVRSTMATMIKKFRSMVNSDVVSAEAMLKDVISYIDSAKSKGVIHSNTASRKISRLNLLLNKAKLNNANKVEEKPVEVKEEVVAEENVEKKTRTTRKTAKSKAE